MKTLLIVGTVALVVACGRTTDSSRNGEPGASRVEPIASGISRASGSDDGGPGAAAADARGESLAFTVPVAAKSGAALSGSATLVESEGGVRVTLLLAGAKPGLHAVHVHENPDCSAPDAKSAGPHYNPTHQAHGLPPAEPRHLGDLGNISVDAQGAGRLDMLVPGASLEPGKASSFLDRALVVHEKEDEGAQPDGQAGPRIGCAVIRR